MPDLVPTLGGSPSWFARPADEPPRQQPAQPVDDSVLAIPTFRRLVSFVGRPRGFELFAPATAADFRDDTDCRVVQRGDYDADAQILDHGFVWGGNAMSIGDDEEETDMTLDVTQPLQLNLDGPPSPQTRSPWLQAQVPETQALTHDTPLGALNFDLLQASSSVDLGTIPNATLPHHFPSLIDLTDSPTLKPSASPHCAPTDALSCTADCAPQSSGLCVMEPRVKREGHREAEHKFEKEGKTQDTLPALEREDDHLVVVGYYTKAERKAKIARFKAKKDRRVWDKKINYSCRKTFADRRPRVGGRFLSKEQMDKLKEEETARQRAERLAEKLAKRKLKQMEAAMPMEQPQQLQPPVEVVLAQPQPVSPTSSSHSVLPFSLPALPVLGESESKLHEDGSVSDESSDSDDDEAHAPEALYRQFSSLGVSVMAVPDHGTYSSCGSHFKFGLMQPDLEMMGTAL